MKTFLVTYAEELDKDLSFTGVKKKSISELISIHKKFKTVPIEATSKEDAFRIARNKLSLHWSQIEIVREINI